MIAVNVAGNSHISNFVHMDVKHDDDDEEEQETNEVETNSSELEEENGCDQRTFNTCLAAYKKAREMTKEGKIGFQELSIKIPCVFGFLFELKRIVDKEGKKGFERICRYKHTHSQEDPDSVPGNILPNAEATKSPRASTSPS